MAGSGRSRLRSSSYEKHGGADAFEARGRAAVRRGGGRGPATRGALGAAAAVVALLALAGCGSLPTNVGKTDTLGAAARSRQPAGEDRDRARSPSPEQTGVRLLPLGAYSLDTRHPARAARDAARSTSSTTCSRTTRPAAC